jgi:ATP-dependent helicase HrpB
MDGTRLLPAAGTPGGDLPVRSSLPAVVAAVRQHGSAVLVAPPGSGKTTLLPLALADVLDGLVIVAEPRRIATRAAANRLAAVIGERPGRRIGYAMRDERVRGSQARVEVVTTGLLVQRLQREPELPGVAAIVIDECHERQLDADLALAFCVEVQATLRDDLALVATSATADSAAIAAALGEQVPVISASAAMFDIEIVWAPPPKPLPLLADARVDPSLLDHVAAVVRRALDESDGDVLVFVPGEAEITAICRRLAGTVTVLPLFGRQNRAEQDRALTAGPGRRVVVTTSIAESSLTVPGVRIVVDAGLARQPQTDQARGLSALVTTRVSRSSADQRAGRAGREGPGRVYRCWSSADHAYLAAHPAPEIATADLAGFALTVAAWGAPGGRGLALLDAPPAPALTAATELLHSLDAIDAQGRITSKGRQLAAIPAHPRLARAVLDGATAVGAERAREVVAMLAEGSGREDDLADRLRALRRGQDRDASARWRAEVRRLGSGGAAASPLSDDLAVGTVVGLAYPDRLARLRQPGGTTYQLAGGTGASLDATSRLRGTEWLAVAVADRPPGRADARIRSAAPIDEATARAVGARLLGRSEQIRWQDGQLLLRRSELLGAIRLKESALTDPDPALVSEAVREGIRLSGLGVLPWTDEADQLRQRLAFCRAHLGQPWPAVDDDTLLAGLDSWLGPDLLSIRRSRDLARLDLVAGLRRLLPWAAATRFDEFAPLRLRVPSGSWVRLRYDGAEPPVLAVKVQEVFGWAATPALAGGRVPVVLHLLSPAGRPVAITADLTSFWQQGYPQVRADLRARYPRHPWPDDPWRAEPTKRVKPRR